MQERFAILKCEMGQALQFYLVKIAVPALSSFLKFTLFMPVPA